jgi:hypothetical protein
MVGSIFAVIAFVAAGLALSAWSIRIRGRRFHPANPSDAGKGVPPLMPEIDTEERNLKLRSDRP